MTEAITRPPPLFFTWEKTADMPPFALVENAIAVICRIPFAPRSQNNIVIVNRISSEDTSATLKNMTQDGDNVTM